MLTDTHCHLDAGQFAGEPTDALLERAAAAGVTRLVTIGTELATSRAAVGIAQAHANGDAAVWATVGVDPNDCADWSAAMLAELRSLAASPRVVAIGEIGLDYYWNRASKDVQRAAFQDQLSLALDLGLPVVIHCRDAHDDTEVILTSWAERWRAAPHLAGRPPGVMHCFSGDLDEALRLVGAGFLISIAGPVTYKNADKTQGVAAGVPLEALVVETDAPYLAPVPRRGSRNEPAFVQHTAAFIAGLRGMSLEALAAQTSANAARLFSLPLDIDPRPEEA